MQRSLKSKFLIKIGIITVISLFFVSVASAANFGTFNYWYSGKNEIGYFKSKTVKVYSNKGIIGMPTSTFNSAASSTMAPWASTLGITITTGTASSNNVAIYGQDRNIATSMGAPADAAGYSVAPYRNNVGSGTYNQSSKIVYEIPSAEVYLIWDTGSNYNTSSLSVNQWKAIAAHEGGHAAGYYGHDAASSSVQKALMNPYPTVFYDSWGVSTPQLRDIYHMSNVY